MKRSCGIIVLAAVLQVIFGQSAEEEAPPQEPYSDDGPHQGRFPHPPHHGRIPRHCWAPPPGVNIHECCPIPNLYPDEVLESCGIEKPADGPPPPPPHKHHPDFQCKKGKCLMTQSNLLNEDESIDYEKLNTFIDEWAQANPNFTDAILIAKEKCASEKGPPGPHKICEPDKVFFCLNSMILWNCNLREDIDSCKTLKEHMDECKPYYEKLKEPEQTR